MVRMNFDSFKFILMKIEKDIAPIELERGGLKPISAAERLTHSPLFSHWGNVPLSLSFQFRISGAAISYTIHEVCKAIINNPTLTYLKVPNTEKGDSVC